MIADASANMFKAMHDLRTDRSTTNRLLNSNTPMSPTSKKICATFAIPKCPRWPARSPSSEEWNSPSNRCWCPSRPPAEGDNLAAEGILGSDGKPKASRPRLSPRNTWTPRPRCWKRSKSSRATLAATVNHQDATIDQLLAIKQIAWLLRNTAGEASLIVSVGLSSGGKVSPESKAGLHQIRRRHRGSPGMRWSSRPRE